jgi:hypothetical protein
MFNVGSDTNVSSENNLRYKATYLSRWPITLKCVVYGKEFKDKCGLMRHVKYIHNLPWLVRLAEFYEMQACPEIVVRVLEMSSLYKLLCN